MDDGFSPVLAVEAASPHNLQLGKVFLEEADQKRHIEKYRAAFFKLLKIKADSVEA